MLLQALSFVLSSLILLAAYMLVEYFNSRDGTVLAILLGLIDLTLPTLFSVVTSVESHIDEESVQDSLLLKLVW